MSKKLDWWEQPLDVCPICKKEFAPAVEHAWKIGYKPKEKLVCSYTCMRVWEKKHIGTIRRRYGGR